MRTIINYLSLYIFNLFIFTNISIGRYVENLNVTLKNSKKPILERINLKNEIKNNNSLYFDDNVYNKDDKYYLIYVDKTYTLQDNETLGKRKEQTLFLDSVIKEINEIIIENKNTFKNQNKLNKLIKNSNPLKKRNGNVQPNLVSEIASVSEVSVLFTYLSYELKNIINSIPYVSNIEPDRELNLKMPYSAISSRMGVKKDKFIQADKLNLDTNTSKPILFDENNIIEKIKNETSWKEIEVKKNADLHLSLISQGKFDSYESKDYDTSYYFPKSAGEGIDVYILDGDFNFNQQEFSNVNEREVKCLGIFRNGILMPSDNCALPNNPHGELVSDAVGGINHGVARKANIFGMAIEFDGKNGTTITRSNFIKTLDYIRKNVPMKKNKSVFNISLGEYFSIERDKGTINFVKETFNELNKNGVVTVVSAGNNQKNVVTERGNKKYIRLPCVLDSVICVGGIDNYGYFGDSDLSISEAQKIKYINPNDYKRVYFSNYGENVDILAPGLVNLEYINEYQEKEETIFLGTSFSSPIVAGVAATIMSEYSNIKFNSTLMMSYLYEFGLKDVIDDARGPNLFINNGKKSIYNHFSFTNDEN